MRRFCVKRLLLALAVLVFFAPLTWAEEGLIPFLNLNLFGTIGIETDKKGNNGSPLSAILSATFMAGPGLVLSLSPQYFYSQGGSSLDPHYSTVGLDICVQIVMSSSNMMKAFNALLFSGPYFGVWMKGECPAVFYSAVELGMKVDYRLSPESWNVLAYGGYRWNSSYACIIAPAEHIEAWVDAMYFVASPNNPTTTNKFGARIGCDWGGFYFEYSLWSDGTYKLNFGAGISLNFVDTTGFTDEESPLLY